MSEGEKREEGRWVKRKRGRRGGGKGGSNTM